MATLAYDPSRQSLYSPETRKTLFCANVRPAAEALAIEASRLAYLRFEESNAVADQLTAALALAEFASPTHFIHAPSDGAGFGALRDDGTALLAFRGTQADHLLDALIDARILLRPWKSGAGRVHRGFNQTALGLWPQVEDWLKGQARLRTSLLICGHSLGAAIATLLALPSGANHLITLGSPRVGDGAFCATLLGVATLSITRLVDCCDGVTQLPTKIMGYQHVGQVGYVDRHGVALGAPPARVIESDRVIARMEYAGQYALTPGNVAVRDLADHAPINYARAFWHTENGL
jgi:hypothetical protein